MIVGFLRGDASVETIQATFAALESKGCQRVVAGQPLVPPSRDGLLASLLRNLRKGDTLVVQSFDCVGETLPQLVSFVADLSRRGVNFESLRENISTCGRSGGAALSMLFEHLSDFPSPELRGSGARMPGYRRPGRPKLLSNGDALRARRLIGQGRSVKSVAEALGVSRATLYRYLEKVRNPAQPPASAPGRLVAAE